MKTTELNLITPVEAAKRLKKSESSVRRLLNSGRLTRHYACEDNPEAFKRVMVDEQELALFMLSEIETEEVAKCDPETKEEPSRIFPVYPALFRMRVVSDAALAVVTAFILALIVLFVTLSR
jgi:hypothetical protein